MSPVTSLYREGPCLFLSHGSHPLSLPSLSSSFWKVATGITGEVTTQVWDTYDQFPQR